MDTRWRMAGRFDGEGVEGSLKLEETELRLGLPGGGGIEVVKTSGKRGFTETAVDLELNLPTGGSGGGLSNNSEEVLGEKRKSVPKEMNLLPCTNDPAYKPPVPKAQVVGWPPVRSFRKNILAAQSENNNSTDDAEKISAGGASLVKVSMDGAPYLRKVDLKMYKSYHDLSIALENMFCSFTIRNCASQGINGRKLMDLLNGSEYVPTYEDKDGDWMLVGDVTWKMFVDSCKRLRIMKGSEATGLAPRAVEKCKNGQ